MIDVRLKSIEQENAEIRKMKMPGKMKEKDQFADLDSDGIKYPISTLKEFQTFVKKLAADSNFQRKLVRYSNLSLRVSY
jgi:hypothetical protein